MKAGLVAITAAGAVLAGSASACDVGALQELRPSGVEQVTVQFRARQSEMPLDKVNQVAQLVDFIRSLGAEWAAGGGSGDTVIRFYKAGSVAASVFLASDTLATSSCRRKLSSAESAELFSILTETE